MQLFLITSNNNHLQSQYDIDISESKTAQSQIYQFIIKLTVKGLEKNDQISQAQNEALVKLMLFAEFQDKKISLIESEEIQKKLEA